MTELTIRTVHDGRTVSMTFRIMWNVYDYPVSRVSTFPSGSRPAVPENQRRVSTVHTRGVGRQPVGTGTRLRGRSRGSDERPPSGKRRLSPGLTPSTYGSWGTHYGRRVEVSRKGSNWLISGGPLDVSSNNNRNNSGTTSSLHSPQG